MFSVELVGAVRFDVDFLRYVSLELTERLQIIRQGLFVEELRNLHWTEPDFFDKPGNEAALVHAATRYHAFVILELEIATLILIKPPASLTL
jgi:hypothetical protein